MALNGDQDAAAERLRQARLRNASDERKSAAQRFYRANREAFLLIAGLVDRTYSTISIDDRAGVENAVRLLGWTQEERALFVDGAPRGALGKKIQTAMKEPGFAADPEAPPAKGLTPAEVAKARNNAVLSPEDFVITTGNEPADWPARLAPSTLVKVVTHGEGVWTKVLDDDGDAIVATMDDDHTNGVASVGDPVVYRRVNVRDILLPESGQ